jgi:hypothetical protein
MQTSLRRKIKSLSFEISSAIVVLFSSDSTLFWLFPERKKVELIEILNIYDLWWPRKTN